MRFVLDEICEVLNGGAWGQDEYSENGIGVIKVSNLKSNGIVDTSLSYLPPHLLSKYEKHLLKAYDLIVTTVGSHAQLKESAAGRSFILPKDFDGFLLNQNCVVIRPKSEDYIDKRFLGYYGQSERFQNFVQSLGRGAANQMRIAMGGIKKMEIDIPPLPTQRRIASILSAYDDLIENNHKRIKLLEEAAQNIYREWFVHFRFPGHERVRRGADGLPEGWRRESVGNIIESFKRKPKVMSDHYLERGPIPVIDQADGYIAGYTDLEDCLHSEPLPIIVFGDHTRRVKYVNFPFASGADGTQLMYPKQGELLPTYFYLAVKNVDLSNYAYARHYKFLKEERLTIPSGDVLKQFNELTEPMLNSTIHLLKYSGRLKEARDILLPRLMNRTIEV